MSNNTKLLWICPKSPLPAIDGARHANSVLIKSITDQKITIDLIFFAKSENQEELQNLKNKLGINQAYCLIRKDLSLTEMSYWQIIKNLILHWKYPLSATSFISKLNIKLLNSLLASNHYSAIVLDGLHPSSLLLKCNSNLPITYRAHNVETELWEQRTKQCQNILFKLALAYQTARMLDLEKTILLKSKAVACVSENDISNFKKLAPTANYQLIPIAVSIPEQIKEEQKLGNLKRLLFLGKLDWLPNKEGLIWFLENVWSKIQEQKNITTNLELHIAGSGNSDYLNRYLKQSRQIVFHGFVESTEKIYQNSDLVIIPIFTGSGTRVKAIEAAAQGLPIISTSLGIAGLGFSNKKDYLDANTNTEWIEILNNLEAFELDKLKENAKAIIKANFGTKACGEKFINLLEFR